MRVRRRSDSTLTVSLGLVEAEALLSLPERLRDLLRDPEANRRITARLFPAAYSDERREQEYRRLLGDDLVRRKLEAVDLFERTLEDRRHRKNRIEVTVRPEDFELWLGFVNDMRIVLGTELGIEDDDWGAEFDWSHPRADDLVLLHFLSWLEEELLRGIGFQPPPIDPDDLRHRRR